jgi:hypothetical protein
MRLRLLPRQSFRHSRFTLANRITSVFPTMHPEQRESTEPLCIDVVFLYQAQMVRVFGLQSRDQKFELGKAA